MPVNLGSAADRGANCLMCAIAGVLGANTNLVQLLIGAAQQNDDGVLAAWGLTNVHAEEQFKRSQNKAWRLIYLTLRKGSVDPWYGYRSATAYAELKDAGALAQWMGQFAVGTRFAVWGCQEMNGLGAHWNCAIKRPDGDIEFIDYQPNFGGAAPVVQDNFVAPVGEDDGDYEKFSAFAFTKTPVRALSA